MLVSKLNKQQSGDMILAIVEDRLKKINYTSFYDIYWTLRYLCVPSGD